MSKTLITFAAAAAALMAGSALASTPAAPKAAKPAASPQQVAANALPPAANVAPSGQPAAAADAKAVYAVNGFRSATFGMTGDEVKAAITHDFGVAADKIAVQGSPLEGTSAMVVQTSLPPGPGQATITYIFGAASHKLMHVNVIWATGAAPTDADRGAIATAGLQLTQYFQGQAWQKFIRPQAGQNGVVMFGGLDPKGSAVVVETDGIKLSVKDKDGKVTSNAPKGPAVLHVSYAQDLAHPDVVQIKQGAF